MGLKEMKTQWKEKELFILVHYTFNIASFSIQGICEDSTFYRGKHFTI